MIPRFAPTASLGETLSFLADVLAPGRIEADATLRFEAAFAEWEGAGHALFVPSGRMGLFLLLRALHYPEGSEIVVPAFTFFAIPAMIRHLGYTVVYADVDPATFEVTEESVKAVLTGRTRAVIPTHLFGRTCPLDGLKSLCRQNGIDLVEDCAQACGARIRDKRAGAVGRAAYFTFGITKNFTTFSGGMVVTSDASLATAMRQEMSLFGKPTTQALLKQGITAAAMTMATQRLLFNLALAPILRFDSNPEADRVHRAFEEPVRPMTEGALSALRWLPGGAQARAGLRQLAALDGRNQQRREVGAALLEALTARGVPGLPAPADAGGDHVYVSFALRHPDRARFGGALRRAGVDFSPGYMSPCSAIPELGGWRGRCPEAETVARHIVHLPLYPGLSAKDVERIAAGVAAAHQATEGA